MTTPTTRPLLALDTSGPTARVALVSAAGVRLGGGDRTGERHSAYLLPLCHEILTAAGVPVGELGAIACGRGPGSFTGLRVGLAVAKGLALPFGLPLQLASSLEALALDLARMHGPQALLVPVIDAGKGEVYAQTFRHQGAELAATGPELRLTPAALIQHLRAQAGDGDAWLGGTGVDRHHGPLAAAFGAHAQAGFPGPSADAIAALARRQLASGAADDLSTAVPSYGRPPDITKPKPK